MLHALSAIESAATDDNIKGICIKINGRGSVSAANIEELRRAIERFKPCIWDRGSNLGGIIQNADVLAVLDPSQVDLTGLANAPSAG